MSDAATPNRNQGAGSARRQSRWILPAWGLSLVIHALLLVVLTFTLTTRVAKSLPADDTLEVGIFLKSESPTQVVYENDSDQFVEPLVEDSVEDRLLDPTTDPQTDALLREPDAELDVDLDLLAMSSQEASEASALLPDANLANSGERVSIPFLDAEGVGKSFVWVIDRSASMAHRNSIGLAKSEIVRGLEKLTSEHEFQVIFYDTESTAIPFGKGKMLKATRRNVDRAKKYLDEIDARGGTEHLGPLFAAFALAPEVVFFLTDADLMSARDVAKLTVANRRSNPPATIHAIEFGSGPEADADKPLRRLARENDGSFLYIDVGGLGTRR